jgi:uncharacterized lipoprotein YddW (UPF0748 family)
MMIRIKLILLILILSLSSIICQSSEIRALWALPWDISNPDKIDQLVSDAVENNQTEILAEVRYRADAMYIPNKSDSLYYNPEPRSYILPDNDFDPLEYLLTKAHEQGLQVQAWISTLNATPTNAVYLRSNYIYVNHPDWIMNDINGIRMRASDYMGYFVDPGIPDVKFHLMNVVLDIVNNYPELDGIHLDYIRYPAKKYGYSTESIERFRGKNKTQEIDWNDWRISQITDFIRDMREMALAINPKILITAAVIADIDEAKNDYAQDWVNWINEGIVDRVYPMAYRKDYDHFYDVIADIVEQTPKENVIVGLRAWQEKGESNYKVERIIDKANLCRLMGFGGIALFSYEGIKKCGYFPMLKQALFNYVVSDTTGLLEEDFISTLISSLEYTPLRDSLKSGENDYHSTPNYISDNQTEQDTALVKTFCEIISFSRDSYSLSFYFEDTKDWRWSILDVNSKLLFTKKRTYPRGYFVEDWNGIAIDGAVIQPGVYTLIMCNENEETVFEKRFVVN